MIGVAAIIITVVIFSINLRLNAQDKTIEAYESKVDSKFDVLEAQITSFKESMQYEMSSVKEVLQTQMNSVKETVLAGAEEHKEFRQNILQVNERIDSALMLIVNRDSMKEG